jgi:superfamily II DNA/RNA helicase
MKQPVTIEIESQTKTVDITEQVYYRVNNNEKNLQLNRLLLVEQPDSCMIFCNTRIAVDRVQSFLSRKGYSSQALHGDIPQAKRMRTIQQFKQGEFPLLVATDVAARGIHIDSLSLVINYDVPLEKDSYVHRIGRTGRAGKVGRAITLVTGEDIMSLYAIEEHIGAMIEEEELPSDAFLNEHKTSAEKWIQEKSTKKLPQTKPPQNYEKNKNRPARANISLKPVENIKTLKPAEQAKPASIITKPAVSHTTGSEVALSKDCLAAVQSKNSTSKMPLLQRIIKYIFGKQ